MQGDRVLITGGAGFIGSNLAEMQADFSRARTFGYEPESNFTAELRETTRWFRNNGSI